MNEDARTRHGSGSPSHRRELGLVVMLVDMGARQDVDVQAGEEGGEV